MATKLALADVGLTFIDRKRRAYCQLLHVGEVEIGTAIVGGFGAGSPLRTAPIEVWLRADAEADLVRMPAGWRLIDGILMRPVSPEELPT